MDHGLHQNRKENEQLQLTTFPELSEPQLSRVIVAVPASHRSAVPAQVHNLTRNMTSEVVDHSDTSAPGQGPVQPEGLDTELIELLIDGARYDDLEDVEHALSSHVDVNASDAAGRTALHMAAANGHSSMVDTLLNAGAEPGAKNSEGNTPLHYACLNGHMAIVRQLMMNGASASELNSYSRTPVDEALGKPFQDAVVTAVNSFYKQPLVEVEQREEEADDEQQEDEEMEEDVAMEEREGPGNRL